MDINFSRKVIRAKWRAMMLDEACSLFARMDICSDKCRAISVEAGIGSLDSKNFRAPGNHLKITGLEESIHAFLSATDVLAPQKDSGSFPNVFEMLPPPSFYLVLSHKCFYLNSWFFFFILKKQNLDHLLWRFPDSHLSFDFPHLLVAATKNTVFNCTLYYSLSAWVYHKSPKAHEIIIYIFGNT